MPNLSYAILELNSTGLSHYYQQIAKYYFTYAHCSVPSGIRNIRREFCSYHPLGYGKMRLVLLHHGLLLTPKPNQSKP